MFRIIKKGNVHFHNYHPNYMNVTKNRIYLFFSLNKITKKKDKNIRKMYEAKFRKI